MGEGDGGKKAFFVMPLSDLKQIVFGWSWDFTIDVNKSIKTCFTMLGNSWAYVQSVSLCQS